MNSLRIYAWIETLHTTSKTFRSQKKVLEGDYEIYRQKYILHIDVVIEHFITKKLFLYFLFTCTIF